METATKFELWCDRFTFTMSAVEEAELRKVYNANK